MDFMQELGLLIDLHRLEVSCGATDHVIDADGQDSSPPETA
jgi:hypothetical protein